MLIIREHLRGLRGVKELDINQDAFTLAAYVVPLYADGRSWDVHLYFPSFFPDQPPYVRVPEADKDILLKPHIFKGGNLCIFEDSAWIDGDQPIQVLDEVLRSTKVLLEGESVDDFKDEFNVYWGMQNYGWQVISVDPPEDLPNTFHVAKEAELILISATGDRVRSWYKKRYGQDFTGEIARVGIKIELDAVLTPKQYPKTACDLKKLAGQATNPECLDLLCSLMADRPGLKFVLFSQKSQKGPVIAGSWFLLPNFRNMKKLGNGFQTKNLNLAIKYNGNTHLRKIKSVRSHVARVDHDWVHARGADMGDFKRNKILLMGCGSLGGYVAHLLTRTGVGDLTLLDNDIMKPENLGRHILGCDSLGRSKAEALAETLQKQMPHLNIRGVALDWRAALAQNEHLFEDINLIIVAVADLRCELPLNELARATSLPPIIYGWVEAYAIAGHCLLSTPGSGCRACGIDHTGQWTHAVGHFGGVTLTKEPGGCSYYQEYGPTALLPVAAMISNRSLKALNERPSISTLSTWISDESHLARVGASIADEWQEVKRGDIYSRIHTREWPCKTGCRKCG